MGSDFLRLTAVTELPSDKIAQIRLVLEGDVREAVYRKFMGTPPLATGTDYSQFLAVTWEDLQSFLSTNPDERDRLLPWATRPSVTGMSIRKTQEGYEIWEGERGFPHVTALVPSIDQVVDHWLRNKLWSQGLSGLIPKPQ